MRLFVSLLLLICSDFALAANAKWYNTKQVSFLIDIPTKSTKNWLVGPLMGFPMTVLLPSEDGYRPVLTLTPESEPSNKEINFDLVEQSIGFFQNGRTNYVNERKGKVKKFYEPTKTTNESKLDLYTFGYEYTIDNLHIVEKHVRFVCDGYMVYATARYNPEYHKNAAKDFDKIFDKLKCKKNSGGKS